MNTRLSLSIRILFVIQVFSLIILGFLFAGEINSFLQEVVGSELQSNFGAPIVEEVMKSLPLLGLTGIYLRLARLDFLESIKIDYIIGYSIGGLFGILENYYVYEFFTGFRSATPLLHAFGTGIVGIGIYFVINEGRGGIKKLLLMYLAAISIHSAWNNLASIGSSFLLAILAMAVTAAGLGLFLYFFVEGEE